MPDNTRRRRSLPIIIEGGAAFSPLDVSGLVAWYDFSDVSVLYQDTGRTVAVTSTSDPIGGVLDKSPIGNHLTSTADLTTRPLYETNIQNGKSIARFDDSNDSLRATFTLNQPYTVYLVILQDTWANGDALLTGITNNVSIFMSITTPNIALFAGSVAATNTGLAVDKFGIVQAVFNGASSSLRIDNNAATTGSPGTANPGGVKLGINFNNTVWSDVDVGELIVFSGAISAPNDTLVMAYLNSKWATF